MIENKIYCYVNGFLKLIISKTTSYIVGNKKCFGKICILNLRNKISRQYRDSRNLRNNKDIVITKPDKGNGVVQFFKKLISNNALFLFF